LTRPKAPHNTTQYLSESYYQRARAECPSSTTIEEEWEIQKEEFVNIHASMIGKIFRLHLLGIISLRELEKQELEVTGNEQSGAWMSQVASNDCDLPSDCFLPKTKGMGSLSSELLVEEKETVSTEVLELPTLNTDAKSICELPSRQLT
jgi:hypothetical protein